VVDAAQGNAVGLEGTGDQEDTLGELAQEDDALAGEATGEEDEDGARLERLAVLGGVCGLAGLLLLAYDKHIVASPNRNTLGPNPSRC
jgi:hypothetical protein